jgi:capsular polysaccharide biosynthesis protein
LIEQVEKQLKVSAVPDTRIIEVTFDASDPAVTARFLNALTAQFIEENLESRLQMNRQTSDFLITQVDELRNKLQKSQGNLQAYARSNGLIYTGDKQVLSQEKPRELQTELSQAQADRVNRQSRFEIARNAAPESIPEALNDSNLRSMENNLVDLRKQEAEIAVNFKPEYSKRKMIHAEINSLESAIQNKRRVILLQLDNELKESELRESLLAASYAKQTRLVTDDSEKSIQYDMLHNEVDTNRQIYQVMLQRVKESSIASALKATNVRVVDPARTPLHPYKRILPINAAVGLLLGLMCGGAAVVIQSKTDASLQEPGDTGTLLGIPELGVIPAVSLNPGRNSLLFGLSTQEKQLRSSPLAGSTLAKYPNKISDSFRAVIASILFAFPRGRALVLVITSPGSGEGKTTASANMALTLANMGHRVLLIDGDVSLCSRRGECDPGIRSKTHDIGERTNG